MTIETKRDVFREALDDWWDSFIHRLPNDGLLEGWPKKLADYSVRYSAALPDDLPVIPKAVGEYIERQKQGSTLRSAIIAATDFHAVDYEETEWIFYHSETFALAWVLGVWRVEETGEIMKLEAEK